LTPVGVDPDAGDKGVVCHPILEHGGGRMDEARDIAAGIDYGIPCAPPQRPEIPCTIATELFGVRKEFWACVPVVEERHSVATVESRMDDMAPEKERPTED